MWEENGNIKKLAPRTTITPVFDVEPYLLF